MHVYMYIVCVSYAVNVRINEIDSLILFSNYQF